MIKIYGKKLISIIKTKIQLIVEKNSLNPYAILSIIKIEF